MNIVSYIKDSFQEFKDYQSLVLFCSKCNLNCDYCYNINQVMYGEIIGTSDEIIDKELNDMHEAVVFLGGEPCMWSNGLVDSAIKVKEKGKKTKVYTNGLYYNVVKLLNEEKLIDSYSVDFKCIKNCSKVCGSIFTDRYYLKSVDKTIRNILDNNIELELRTTESMYIDIDEVKEYVKNRYPTVNHIVQKDFNIMLKR